MRIAAFSGVHGNFWALKAVFRDIRDRGVHRVVNLGDSLLGPLAPRETAALLQDSPVLSIRGHQDRLLFEKRGAATADLMVAFVRCLLDGPTIRWLMFLRPTRMDRSGILLCHGCSESVDPPCFRGISSPDVIPGPDADAHASRPAQFRTASSAARGLILCGRRKAFGKVVLSNGTMIVSPGILGLPASIGSRPFPHVRSSGSPHARYALIESGGDGYQIQPVEVIYPWDKAAASALANGRPDWAIWLRTGRA